MIRTGFLVSRPTQDSRCRLYRLPVRGCHPLCRAFPGTSGSLLTTYRASYNSDRAETPSVWAVSSSLATTKDIDLFFLFLQVLRCFSSLRLPLIFFRCAGFTCTGCPIRIFTDHFMLADPRDFSQLAASFFASRSLGILRSLFYPFSCESDEIRHEHHHDATHLIHLVFFRVLEIFFQKTLELVLPVKLQSAINYNKTIKTRFFFDYKLNFLLYFFLPLYLSQYCQ